MGSAWPVRSIILACFIIGPWLVTSTSVFKNPTRFQAEGDAFDWRTKGVISGVYNQGMIGDPMDYVITEGVESLLAIQTGEPVQHLSVDEVGECCDDSFHQPLYQGFDCIRLIDGLCTAADYHAGGGLCNNGTCKGVGKVTSSGYIPSNREDMMLQLIHQVPLIALLDASQPSFQTYTSGVYTDPACSQYMLDHAVQIVGYGTSAGMDYWIIRNSWGTDWGDHGYMRIERGKNMCGIASNVFFPINNKIKDRG